MPPKPPSTPKAPRRATTPAPRPPRMAPAKSPAPQVVVPQAAKAPTQPASNKTAKLGDSFFKKAINAVDKLGSKSPPKSASAPAKKTSASKPASAKSWKPVSKGEAGKREKLGKAGQPRVLSPSSMWVPQSIVDLSKRWKHKTFATTRRKVYKLLAKHPDFLSRKQLATPGNIARMKKGNAPLAPKGQRVGKRKVMEQDHAHERQDGIKDLRVDNLRIVSPHTHINKITRKQKKAAGAEPPADLRDPKKYKKPARNTVSTAQKLKRRLKLY